MLFSCCLIFIRALQTITVTNNIKVSEAGRKEAKVVGKLLFPPVWSFTIKSVNIECDAVVMGLYGKVTFNLYNVCFHLIQSCGTVLREKI